ncbi:MAG: ATP-binding protein [Bacteroidota bacterium]
MDAVQKILIVEDNPGDYFLIKEFLKRTNLPNYQIEHATCVSEAVAQLQAGTFKLILMDLFLPDSEGIQTFEILAPFCTDVPVIVLTGLVDEVVTLKTLKRGAQDYLVKGEYDEKLLEKTIRYAIERQENQQLLKKSEEEYKLLFEGNPLPMFAYEEATLRIHTVNNAAVSFYGYSREAFCQLTIKDLRLRSGHHPEPEILLAQTPGIFKTGEHKHVRKDGSVVHVEIVNHGIRLGGIPSRLAVVYDLTERKKVEEHLRLLESVITNTNDAVLITEAEPIDLPGPRIVYANQAFTRMTGYTLEDVVGKTPRILQGPATDRAQLNKMRENMAQWKGADAELINYKKDGEEFWNSFSLVPVADETGYYTHWVSIQRDVSARRRLEEYSRQKLEKLVRERTEELNASLQKEKQLVELKNQFVAIASHEFRTPLSTIKFATNFLQQYIDKVSGEEVHRKLKKIEDQVTHMTALLEDVIMAGRTGLNKIPVVKTDVNLSQFVERIVEEVENSTKNTHKVKLINTANCEKLNTDEKLLRNIFINLLTNAIKFSPEKNFIELQVREEFDQLVIEVKDEGIGISERDQARLFEAFYRGSNVTSIKGTGLGLSIVKKAVEVLGGEIEIHSKENEGTQVKVTLPLVG